MKSIKIYVEGPSDKRAMEELLAALIETKAQQGIAIKFFDAPDGDRKQSVMLQVPRLAVSILKNDPHAIVVAMPDLYPKNKHRPHETVVELEAAIKQEFAHILTQKGLSDDARFRQRFHVFCFKHDLEALILAAEQPLASRLGLTAVKFPVTWIRPVENQNHDTPPKKIVEALFAHQGGKYKETVDAPLILGAADYKAIAAACPQCFKPFVEFLESV